MGRGSDRTGHSWDDAGQEWYDDEEEEYVYQRRQQPQRPPRRKRRVRRRRSVWPALLTGCGLGILLAVLAAAAVVFFALRSVPGMVPSGGLKGLGGVNGLNNTKTFTQQQSQNFQLTNLNQLQVCNEIGDVTINTNAASNATATTVTTEKIVHSTNQSAANQEFGRIAVTAQTSAGNSVCASSSNPAQPTPGSTNTTPQNTQNGSGAFVVNASVPDNNGILRGTNDAVNVTISVPAALLSNAGTAFLLNITAPIGNIAVDGVSGNLQLKGSSGNITVSQAVLALGSHLETAEGSVTFSGALAIAQDGSPTNGAPTSYIIQSEQGNIDVTLPSAVNVTIDANTNTGKIIANDFALPVQNSNGSMSYNGPLLPNSPNKATNVLVLDVSTGNVTLHKATISS